VPTGNVSFTWRALVEDFQRIGVLPLDHVDRVIRKQKLTRLFVAEILGNLKEHRMISFEPNAAIVDSLAVSAMTVEEFISQHGYTVTNALQVHMTFMREEAANAQNGYEKIKDDPAGRAAQDQTIVSTDGLQSFGMVFTEDANRTESALRAWEEITGELCGGIRPEILDEGKPKE
jgi:hypothetical protein